MERPRPAVRPARPAAEAEGEEEEGRAESKWNREFAGLREFRPGDSPRRIHWKMSARLPGKLLAREYEDPPVRDATILLETGVPNQKDRSRSLRLERAITFAATLVEGLLAENCRVTFRAFTPELVTLPLEPRHGALDDLLHLLAVLQPTQTRSLADLLPEGSLGKTCFVLRISNDPLPPWDLPWGSMILDPADMKTLM
jgi:uncharacterized protein (DUF58 family)